jgi:hypothetical protein
MSLRQEIRETLQKLARETGCKLKEAPSTTKKWLAMNSNLPSGLAEILSTSWPNQTMWIGCYHLWSLKDLSESDRSRTAFAGGYFMIGGAGNGDLLVVKRQPDTLENCEIGLISHEELSENKTQLHSIYEPVCQGFLNLLQTARIEGALPLDFYEARKRSVRR